MEDNQKVNSYRNIYLTLILTVMIWGLSWPAGSIVAHALPALFASFIRYTVALPIFLLAAKFLEKDRFLGNINLRSLKVQLNFAILGILQVTLYNLFFLTGLKYTSSSDATLIISINPTLTAIIAAILYKDERLTKNRIIGLMIALAGVTLIVIQSPNTDVENRLLGDLIIFLAALTWSAYTSFSRPLLGKLKPLTFTAIVTSYGWFFQMITALVVDYDYFRKDVLFDLKLDVVFSLLFLAVFAAVLANILFNRGIAVIGPSRTSIFVNLVPVFGIVFSIILLGDQFSFNYIIALILILYGVYTVNKK